MIELKNDHIRVVIAEEVGAEVRFLGRPGGDNLLAWYDWRTPLPARDSTTYGSSALDWSSEYRGGWQELFPNAGAECEVDGVPLPFHGEASRTAWDVLDQSDDTVELTVGVRLPLVLRRRMSLAADAPVMFVEELVVNDSCTTVPFVWVHHPAFVAKPDCRVDLPPAMVHVDSSYTTPLGDLEPGSCSSGRSFRQRTGRKTDISVVPDRPTDRLCYAVNLKHTWAGLRSGPSGIALAWDAATHPYSWIWTEIAMPTMPSYARSRIIAIEPASYWPADGLESAIADGRAHSLAPGDAFSSWLTISLFDATDQPVSGVDRDGTVHIRGRRDDDG